MSIKDDVKAYLKKLIKSTYTETKEPYGYVDGCSCYENVTECVRGDFRRICIGDVSNDIEVIYVTQESRRSCAVYKEKKNHLDEHLSGKGWGTSWCRKSASIIILRGENIFFTEFLRRVDLIDDIIFKDDIAIIEANYFVDLTPSFLGYQPGDMGYEKRKYKCEASRVEKIPL